MSVKSKYVSLIVFLVGILSPAVAFAALPSQLLTYTTHGDFDVVVKAFENIALIMSDNTYKGLFFTIIVLITAGMAAVNVGKGAFGGKMEAASWARIAMSMFIGAALFTTFVSRTTNMTVYDDYLNRQKAITGVPEGVVFLVNFSNLVEEGIQDIIDTTDTDGFSYRKNPSAITLNILKSIFETRPSIAGLSDDAYYAEQNIANYIQECVLFEMKLPNARISRKELFEATDFTSIFDNATNNAKFLVHYSDTHKEGQTLSCTQSWALTKAYLNTLNNASAESTKFWGEKCKDAGIGDNVSGASGSNPTIICRNTATDLIEEILGTSLSSHKIFKQHMISSIMMDIATSADSSAFDDIIVQSDRSQGISNIGAAVTQSRWSRWFKAHMKVAFLGMLPFLMLFLATPWYNKVLSFTIGMFVFFLCWSVCQSVLFNAFANVARDMFADTAQVKLGMAAPIMFAQDANKALATFGAFEGLAFTLAATFSAIFVKASGAGFSRYGQDSLRQTGSSGRSHANESTIGSPAAYANRLSRDVEGLADAESYGSQLRTQAGQGEMIMNSQARFHRDRLTMSYANQAFGNGTYDYMRTAKEVANTNQTKQLMGVKTSEALKAQAAARGVSEETAVAAMTNYAQNSKIGEAAAFSKLVSDLKMDPEQTMDFIKGVQSSTTLGNAEGLYDSYKNAKENKEFSGNFKDYIGMQKELEASKGFIDKATTNRMAEKYFGGDERAFLQNQAKYNQTTTAAQLSELNKSGKGGVEAVANVLGRAKAVENMAKSSHVQNAGLDTHYRAVSSQLYEGAAKQLMKIAAGEILDSGQLFSQTRNQLRNLAADPAGRAHLQSQGMMNFAVGDQEQAENLAQFLNSNGHSVQANDLKGSNVGMGLWADKNGQMKSGFVASKNGTVVDHQNMKHDQMFLTAEQAQAVTGKENAQKGMYNIYSNPNGEQGAYIEGKNGFRHQSSDISLVESANGAHQLQYVDPNTGETALMKESAGAIFREDYTNEHNYGTRINGDSVRSALLDGDESTSVAGLVYGNENMSNASREEAKQSVMKGFAEMMTAYMKHDGMYRTSFLMDANGNVQFSSKDQIKGLAVAVATGASAGVGAGMKVMTASDESTAVNLNMVLAGKIFNEAEKIGRLTADKSKGGEFNHEAAQQYAEGQMTKALKGQTLAFDGQELTAADYGASALGKSFVDSGKIILEGVQSAGATMNELGGQVKDAAMGIISGNGDEGSGSGETEKPSRVQSNRKDFEDTKTWSKKDSTKPHVEEKKPPSRKMDDFENHANWGKQKSQKAIELKQGSSKSMLSSNDHDKGSAGNSTEFASTKQKRDRSAHTANQRPESAVSNERNSIRHENSSTAQGRKNSGQVGEGQKGSSIEVASAITNNRLKTAATNRNDHDRHQNDHSVQGKNGQNKVSDEKESASPENMYANPLDSNGSESDRSAAADEIKTDAATPNSDDADRSEIRSKLHGHEGESADERSNGSGEEVWPETNTAYVAPGVTDQSDSVSNNTRTDNGSFSERRNQGNERQPKGEKEVDAGDMYASQSTIDEPEGDRLSADAPTTSTSSQPVVTITGNNDADRFTGKPFSKNQDRNPRRDDSRKGVVASDGYGNHLNSDEPKESQITNGKNTKPESATPNKNGLDRYESRSGFSGQGQSVSMGKQSQESSEYSTGNQKSSHLDTGEKGLSKKADANRIDGNRNQRLISPDQKVGIAVSARSNATSEVGSQQIAFDTNKQAAGQNWKEGGSGITPNKMDAGNSNTSQQKNHPQSSKNDEGQSDIREGAIQQDVKDESDRMSFDSDVKPETATSNKKEVGRFETEAEAYQFVENVSHQPEVVTSYNNNGSFQSVEPEISQPIEKAGRYTEMMASIETEIHQPSESANPQPEMMVSNGDGAGHYQSKTARAMRELNEVAGTAQPEQSDPVNHGQADDSVEAISAEPEAHRPFDSRSHQPEMVASNEPLVHQPDQSTNRQQEMPDFNGDGAVRYQSKTAHAMRKFNEIAGTAKSTQKTSWDGDGRRVNEQSDGNSISTAGSNSRPERSQRMKVDIPEELLLASAQRINRVERIMQNGPRMVER